ncbi:nitroreductase family deazaflavin-dependent oxidoreductase [Actinospica sp. MGRD01-02]|uniref:Nitroreductase family deazaflavin-dependent oxidoreductase n=1 Tax=Actinospica acidithermotolerans TaxID=2828514 RepID=A0A941IPC9_9ACTN|nr:nitroreductase family deazaflavin-dependent oxidoreductase [Actinospica acidithermotolerans]MBR7830306.1 nitroreductase family deazaflavin-dependent oxidoreductase [Actinospica acidithermotolerans]
MTRAIGPVTRAVLKAPSRLYDARAGWLLGHRFLRLTHRGRVSGREYRTVLEVVGRLPETGEYVVVSGLGRGSDWFRNIQAAPALRVQIGRGTFEPAHRVLEPEEAAAVLADYERRNRVLAPIVRTVLSRLIGWRYDSSSTARERLTAELPFVAFRPLPAGDTQPGRAGRPGALGSRWAGIPRARLSLTAGEPAVGVHLIELRGELDADGAAIVLAEATRYVQADATVVLDASGLEFVDSSGLHALIVLARIARTRDARLRLADPSPPLRRLLTRTRADRVIDVRTYVDDALEH